MQTASIIPAKTKFAIKKAAKHFTKALTDFAPNAAKTIISKKAILTAILNHSGILSIKIISEKSPARAEAARNLSALNSQAVIAAAALRSK